MFKRSSSKSIFWIFLLIMLFGLSACGGGSGDSGAGSDSDSNGTDSGGNGTEVLDVVARVDGEAVPGQLAKLQADVSSADGTSSFSWQQTGGPTVDLVNTDSKIVQFRVPPLGKDTQFSFLVTVTDDSGHSARHRVRMRVKALSWKNMHVHERRVHQQFVVFRADKEINNQVELYRADLDGSNIVKLNGPLTPGGQVTTFSISPDGDYVAYLADEDTRNVSELYITDAVSGGSERVSDDLVAGGNVTPGFVWAPDSSRVAYHADQEIDDTFELFAGFPDAGPSEKLSGGMTAGGNVIEANFFWSSDSHYIAYRADQFTDETFELFVSDADGSNNSRVSIPLTPGGGVLGNFAWSVDSEHIAYLAEAAAIGVHELFVVEFDGANNTRVSGPLVSDGTVLDFAWSPDGSALAYRAEQLTDEFIELFRVRPDGTDNSFVSALPSFGGVSEYAWSPDSEAIAYLADQLIDEQIELFVTGPSGTVNRRVSGEMIASGNVQEFTWSPNSDSLAYRADQNTDGQFELFTSSADGLDNNHVSGLLAAGGNVQSDWLWSGDGDWLAYRAQQRFPSKIELFSALPDSSANILISSNVVDGGNVKAPEGDTFQWTRDSTRIVYAADQDEDQTFELYVAAADGGLANTRLSGALTTQGDVVNFSLTSRPGQQQSRNVLVLAALALNRIDDVISKLEGTALFDTVDQFDANVATPTQATLQEYGAVLVFSDGTAFANNVALGNVLADYVDSGGGVVVGIFSFDPGRNFSLSGRFLSDNYFAIPPGPRTSGGFVGLGGFDADHPLMNGINSFNGGSGSYRQVSGAVVSGATIVARWSDNRPLVVSRKINGTRRVDLGFFPVSSDDNSAFWNASTDGDLIMANALLYVMGEI